jgi:hypothetical protein
MLGELCPQIDQHGLRDLSSLLILLNYFRNSTKKAERHVSEAVNRT